MKDSDGRIIGFELLHYRPADSTTGLAVDSASGTHEWIDFIDLLDEPGPRALRGSARDCGEFLDGC